MKPSLVMLAAGISSRYGGCKQLEPVGPGGETVTDYTVYDAWRSGFGRVVFVIRAEMEPTFRETLGARIGRHLPVNYVHQRLEALPAGFQPPAGRTKPWGTGHAVLAAGDTLADPFVVANADDYYGASSVAMLGEFLQQRDPGPVPTYAMVGYPVRDTLPATGAVSRGLCRCTPDGWLERIDEIIGIERHGDGGCYRDATGATQLVDGGACVSMNLWAFRPQFLRQALEGFTAFLRANGQTLDREFYLPVAVADVMRQGRARVRVLPARERWCGLTHRADRSAVTDMVRDLVARGVYPERLWE
ncbi:MAG TPA: NTP transferase domain-containing protein [Phycisphaerae bacterium]|nr:NTP transferase domain-containing protein [Phycisphaerae bacterium]HNU45395.1 NTP transferase domain-containing protein [Phycisphaerae bacterium]